MATRAGLAQEIAESERAIVGLRKEVDEIRRYISSNEHAMQGQPESLRAITQESLAKARANLARKEAELQAATQVIAANRVILTKLEEMERKQQEIAKLERDQETITNLLEKARSDYNRIENDYLAMTAPVAIPQFSLLLPDGKALNLPTDKTELLIGCLDKDDRIFPDIDLAPYNARQQGVSRRHAELRYANHQWTLIDLGSSNGTFVNETAVQPGVATPVMDGAKVRFGNFGCTLLNNSPSKTVRL